MAQNKMLIDATHAEETRVVVVRGNKVEEFDFESINKQPLKGNIYLAKVTRVEPSLQAAFVEYGGNKQGFLAFSEIHPDYYQIPVADREALLQEEMEAAQREDEEQDEDRPKNTSGKRFKSRRRRGGSRDKAKDANLTESVSEDLPLEEGGTRIANPFETEEKQDDQPSLDQNEAFVPSDHVLEQAPSSEDDDEEEAEEEQVEQLGESDSVEDVSRSRMTPLRRKYKIQEVIRRRQVVLIQVVKEERGNKGAAVTTYLSLAGRYAVLMPNSARGGGISRKITAGADRKRLKEVVSALDVPTGMGVILRTAGAARSIEEIRRDFEYLIRLWETIRDNTLSSLAPALVHEEGSLIKRSIRDLYGKEVDEVHVAGESAIQEAKDFMKMLMPTHVKHVHGYNNQTPIFAHFGVEQQLDAMFSQTVPLKSGGYMVLNQTEALVSIDINSGKATKEHHIEDTALKTNIEAAEEIARQLRLRDLAGLIVIDFIDMEEFKNNRTVERKLKDALKHDRARIQVGRISHFGLLEMSRQRLRSSVLENSTERCAHCMGSGLVRSKASLALHILRALEEHLHKNGMYNAVITTRQDVALYLLNSKRSSIAEIEARYKVTILVEVGDVANGHVFNIERGEQVHTLETMYKAPKRDDKPQPHHQKKKHIEISSNEDVEDAEFETIEGSEDENKEPRNSRRRRKRGKERFGGKENSVETEGLEGSETESISEEVQTENSEGLSEDGAPKQRSLRRGKFGRLDKRRPKGERKNETVIHPEGEVVSAESSNQEARQADMIDYNPSQPAYVLSTPVEDVAIEKPARAPRVKRERIVQETAAPVETVVIPEPVVEAPAPRRRTPDPEPVIEETVDTNAPKKRGWWSRG